MSKFQSGPQKAVSKMIIFNDQIHDVPNFNIPLDPEPMMVGPGPEITIADLLAASFEQILLWRDSAYKSREVIALLSSMSADDVTKLTPQQVVALDRDFFHLSSSACAGITASQIAAIDSLLFSQFLPDQLSALSFGSVTSAYAGITHNQIKSLNSVQVSFLSHIDCIPAVALAGLTADNIRGISKDFFSTWFKAEQIAKIPAAAFGALTIEQLNSFSFGSPTSAYAGITPDQISRLQKSQISALQHIDCIPAVALAGLTADNIRGISKDFFSTWFKAEQIAKIPAAAFGALTIEQLNSFSFGSPTSAYAGITPDQISRLQKSQISALQHIDCIPAVALAGLTADNIRGISKDFFSTWFKAEQIAKIPAAAFGALTIEQLNSFSFGSPTSAYAGITPDQISRLQKSQISALQHIDCIPAVALAGLTADNIRGISKDFFSTWFKAEQIAKIPAAAFGALTIEQLNSFSFGSPTSAYAGITPDQISRLQKSQISALQHIDCIPAVALAGLTADNISGLNQTVIMNLTVEQLTTPNNGNSLLARLTKYQVGWLTSSQLGGIGFNAVKVLEASGLTAAQLAMPVSQMDFLGDDSMPTELQHALIRELSSTQISHLSQTAIVNLTAKQLNEMYGDRPILAMLTEKQVAWLRPFQMAEMDDAMLQYINSNGLTAAQLSYVDKTGIVTVLQDLLPAQIGRLNANAVYALTATQLSYELAKLNADSKRVTVLQTLTDAQFGELNPAALVSLRSDEITSMTLGQLTAPSYYAVPIYELLSPTQVAALSSAQISQFTTSQIQALNAVGFTSEQLMYIYKDAKTVLSDLANVQLGQLAVGVVAALTSSQINSLNSTQLYALNSAGLAENQIAQLDASQIQALNAAGLTKQQLDYVDKNHKTVFSDLSNEQLGELPADVVATLTLPQLRALDRTQIQVLNIAGLAEQLAHPNLSNPIFASLKPAQLALLSAAIVANLAQQTPLAFVMLTTDQIQALNITGLTATQLKLMGSNGKPILNLLSATQVSTLTATQIKQLDASQIQALNAAGLTSDQLGYTDKSGSSVWNNLLAASNSSSLLGALNAYTVGSLSSDQIKQLDASQIQALNAAGLTSDQLGYTDKSGSSVWNNLLAASNSSSLLGALNAYTVGSLSSDQIKQLDASQIQALNAAGLTSDQLGYTDKSGSSVWNNLLAASNSSSLLGALNAYTVGSLSSDQIKQLDASQIQALNAAGLTSDQLGYTDGSKLQFTVWHYLYTAIKSLSLLGALNANAVSSLSAAQISDLSLTQIGQLNTAGLTSTQIKQLDASQIQALNAAGLTSDQLGYTDKSGSSVWNNLLAASNSSSLLGALNAYTVGSLSSDQIKQLDASQIQALNAAGLTSDQLGYGYSNSSQQQTLLGELNAHQLAQLNPATVASLTRQQLGLINASGHSILENLTAYQTRWLNQDTVAGLTRQQLGLINASGHSILEDFTAYQIQWLNQAAVVGLSAWQLNLIDASGLTVFESFSAQQWSWLDPLSMSGLNSSQLSLTDPSGRSALEYLLPLQVAALSNAALEGLNAAQIAQLNITDLSSAQLGLNDVSGQAMILQDLTASQERNLTATQIKGLSGAQIQTLDAASLTATQLTYIDKAGNLILGDLNSAQIGQLNQASITQLTVTQLTSASNDRVVLAQLTATQIGWLTETQLRDLYVAHKIQNLSAHGLTSEQLAIRVIMDQLDDTTPIYRPLLQLLSNDQIRQLSPATVEKLSATQIRDLSGDQILALNASGLTAQQLDATYSTFWGGRNVWRDLLAMPENIAQLSALNVNTIRSLTDAQFVLLDATQIQALNTAGLTPKQLSYKDKVGNTVWQAILANGAGKGLNPITVNGLSSQQVKQLPVSILANFNSAQIGALNEAALTSSQINSLNSTQLYALNSAGLAENQIAQLDASQIQALNAAGLTKQQLDYVDKNHKTVFSDLSNEQLGELPADVVATLTLPQLRALDRTQIQVLNIAGLAEQLAHPNLSNPIFASLKPAQLALLSAAIVANLAQQTPLAFVMLTTDQIQALNITGLTATQLKLMGSNGKPILNLLSATQVSTLTATQIKQLDASQIQALNAAGLTGDQLKDQGGTGKPVWNELSVDQINALKAAGFTSDDLLYAGNYQGRLLTENPSTHQSHGSVYSSMTSTQVSTLTASQIKQLDASQIQALNAAGLTSDQLGYTDKSGSSVWNNLLAASNSSSLLGALNAYTVGSLSSDQIKQLDASQIQALNAAGLTSDQLGYTDKSGSSVWNNLLAASNSSSLLGALNAYTVGSLSSDQIKQLDASQIQALNAAGLTSDQLGYTDKSGSSVWNNLLATDKNLNLLAALNSTTVGNLSSEKINSLSSKQIGQLNAAGLTSTQIKQLDASQIQALNAAGLTSDQLGYTDKSGSSVWNNLLAASNSSSLLGALNAYTVGSLSSDQIKQLDASQIQALNAAGLTSDQLGYTDKSGSSVWNNLLAASNSSSLLGALNAYTVGSLSSDQIKQLDASQIQALNAAGLTSDQLGYVDKNHQDVFSDLSVLNLNQLTTDLVAKLTAKQIKSLNLAHLQALNAAGLTAPQLQYLDCNDNLVLTDLLPNQISALANSQIAELIDISYFVRNNSPTVFLNNLSANQIGSLSPSLFSQDSIASTPGLANIFYENLTYKQVASLGVQGLFTVDKVPLLSPHAIAGLTLEQWQSMTQEAPHNSIGLILGALNSLQIGQLNSSIIASLTAEQLKTPIRGASTVLQALTAKQLGVLAPPLWKSLDVFNVKNFNKSTIYALTKSELEQTDQNGNLILQDLISTQVKQLNPGAVAQLSADKLLLKDVDGQVILQSLTAMQVAQLTAIQIARLTQEQIQTLDASGLTIEQLEMKDTGGRTVIGDLMVSQLRQLNQQTISALNQDELEQTDQNGNLILQDLISTQVKQLNPGAVAQLSADKLLLKDVDGQVILQSLTAMQVAQLTAIQIARLTQEQIQTLDASGLTIEQLEMKDTGGRTVIGDLSASQLKGLNAQAVSNLTFAQLAPLWDTPKNTVNLSADQVGELNPAVVPMLTISYLSMQDAQGKPILQDFTALQVAQLTDSQIAHLTQEQIQILDASGLTIEQLGMVDNKGASVSQDLNSTQVEQLNVGTVISLLLSNSGLLGAHGKTLLTDLITLAKNNHLPSLDGLFSLLDVAAFEKLTADQVHKMTQAQMRQLSPNLLNSLSAQEWSKFDQTQMVLFDPVQLAFLDPAVSSSFLAHLTSTQLTEFAHSLSQVLNNFGRQESLPYGTNSIENIQEQLENLKTEMYKSASLGELTSPMPNSSMRFLFVAPNLTRAIMGYGMSRRRLEAGAIQDHKKLDRAQAQFWRGLGGFINLVGAAQWIKLAANSENDASLKVQQRTVYGLLAAGVIASSLQVPYTLTTSALNNYFQIWEGLETKSFREELGIEERGGWLSRSLRRVDVRADAESLFWSETIPNNTQLQVGSTEHRFLNNYVIWLISDLLATANAIMSIVTAAENRSQLSSANQAALIASNVMSVASALMVTFGDMLPYFLAPNKELVPGGLGNLAAIEQNSSDALAQAAARLSATERGLVNERIRASSLKWLSRGLIGLMITADIAALIPQIDNAQKKQWSEGQIDAITFSVLSDIVIGSLVYASAFTAASPILMPISMIVALALPNNYTAIGNYIDGHSKMLANTLSAQGRLIEADLQKAVDDFNIWITIPGVNAIQGFLQFDIDQTYQNQLNGNLAKQLLEQLAYQLTTPDGQNTIKQMGQAYMGQGSTLHWISEQTINAERGVYARPNSSTADVNYWVDTQIVSGSALGTYALAPTSPVTVGGLNAPGLKFNNEKKDIIISASDNETIVIDGNTIATQIAVDASASSGDLRFIVQDANVSIIGGSVNNQYIINASPNQPFMQTVDITTTGLGTNTVLVNDAAVMSGTFNARDDFVDMRNDAASLNATTGGGLHEFDFNGAGGGVTMTGMNNTTMVVDGADGNARTQSLLLQLGDNADNEYIGIDGTSVDFYDYLVVNGENIVKQTLHYENFAGGAGSPLLMDSDPSRYGISNVSIFTEPGSDQVSATLATLIQNMAALERSISSGFTPTMINGEACYKIALIANYHG